DHDCSLDFQRTFGTFTPAGLFTIGTVPVTVLSGAATLGIEIANHPIDADPNLPTTFVGTPNCDGFVLGFNSYLLGDPNVACSGDWYDRDGAGAPQAANTAPNLAQPSNMTVNEGATANQAISATDPDGNPVTFSKTSGPTFETVTTTSPGTGTGTGNIALAPGFSDSGTYSSTVTATDNGTPALSNSKSFTITVNNVKRAPTLTTLSTTNLKADQTTNQAITASDPDGNTMTFRKTSGPTFETVTTTNATTGNIALTPGFSDSGTYSSTVTATD